MALLRTLITLVAAASALPAPQQIPSLCSRAVCAGNTASDRSLWCDHSIDTKWYEEAPDTGVTVEVRIIATRPGCELTASVLVRGTKHHSGS